MPLIKPEMNKPVPVPNASDLQGQLPLTMNEPPTEFTDTELAPQELPPEVMQQLALDDPDLLTPEEKEFMQQDEEPKVDVDHYANIAESMDANTLNYIAQDLIERVDEDENSRKDWQDRVKTGIRNLGVSDKTSGGADFPGASKVVHPVLMEACTQFQARAIQELWPSAGPVQTQVLGEQTPDKQDQAERVQNYMNYLYTVEMTEAFTQEDNMLLRLPISGSTFKKMFYDTLKKRLASVFIEPSDFIISYQTTDLRSSPRFTHRIRENKNDVLKKESSGYYVETDMGNVHNEDTDKPQIIDEVDHTDGLARVSYDDGDDRATMYEVYVDYNIDDPNDRKTILKPYIITVDRDQQRIKRIQRNWKPDDELFTKRMYFTHYKFTPGLGFYGYGFLHLIGDMAASATGSLRALLDSAAFSNLQGGYRSRDTRMKGGDDPLAPGEWREVNSSTDELKDAFFPIPYKEPSAVLFNLLGYIDDKAKHLAGTTDTVTGETNPANAPVGTTAMLLEQGTKVFTAIHKRLHEAHKQEFKIMAELIEEYMPDEGYPYLLGQQEGTLMPQDFDDRIDVLPISDPNISSNVQRVAKAQSIIELQQAYPTVIAERIATRRMLEAIQVQNIDELVGTDEAQAENDRVAAEKQEEMERIEKERIQIETQKMAAELEVAKANAVKLNLEAMKLSFEAAALAVTSVDLIATADALMASAGYEDKDGGSMIPPEQVAAMQPQSGMPPDSGAPFGPIPGLGTTPNPDQLNPGLNTASGLPPSPAPSQGSIPPEQVPLDPGHEQFK